LGVSAHLERSLGFSRGFTVLCVWNRGDLRIGREVNVALFPVVGAGDAGFEFDGVIDFAEAEDDGAEL